MKKYKDNALVEPMDDIILLNDNYANKGLYKGYIGTVIDNMLEKDFVVADFSNPITGECIQPVIDIKKEDFRIYEGTLEDQKIGKDYKDLFKK